LHYPLSFPIVPDPCDPFPQPAASGFMGVPGTCRKCNAIMPAPMPSCRHFTPPHPMRKGARPGLAPSHSIGIGEAAARSPASGGRPVPSPDISLLLVGRAVGVERGRELAAKPDAALLQFLLGGHVPHHRLPVGIRSEEHTSEL